MGRINLSALRVRRTALLNVQSKKTSTPPLWADIMHSVPPAQILTRQQPTLHPSTRTRTTSTTSPDGTVQLQTKTTTLSPPRPRKSQKPQHVFKPKSLRYEEDELRSQFFTDHPWELARPRVLLETTGSLPASTDWSTGLLQPSFPLSGESVVQRQLYLLENTPDITREEAYDIARREFYTLRRREATNRRVAAEEAVHSGAVWGRSSMSKAMDIEDKWHDDWLVWAGQQNMEFAAKNAAFSGNIAEPERKALEGTREAEGGVLGRVEGTGPSGNRGLNTPQTIGGAGRRSGAFLARERTMAKLNVSTKPAIER